MSWVYRLVALQTNDLIISNYSTFVVPSEILVKDLFETETTEKRQEDLCNQLCSSLSTSVLVNSGVKFDNKLETMEETRKLITRYPMRKPANHY